MIASGIQLTDPSSDPAGDASVRQPAVGAVSADRHHDSVNEDGVGPEVSVKTCGLSPELANRWLVWQCKMIADVISAAVYNTDGTVLATWPNDADGEDVLQQTATSARQDNRGIIRTEVNFGATDSRIGDAIATPVYAVGQPLAYIAVVMTPRPQSRQNAVLQLIQWSGFWLESLSQLSNGIHQESATFTQSLLTTILGQKSSQKVAMELTNRLAIRLACERASLGVREGLVVRLKSISGLANFDGRTQMARCIEAAMEESLDIDETLCYPPIPGENFPDKAQRDLIAQQGSTSVCTLRLPGRDGHFGAITLERNTGAPFDADTVEWCQSVLGIAGPVIELKRFEERPFWRKTIDAARETLINLLGPERLKLRVVCGSLLAVLLLSSIFSGTYEVRAPARVSGTVSQVVAAPLAGFIKSAEVRAGDTVAEGQLLANIDDRSLQLELTKWQSEKNKTDKAYQEALAMRARTELSILRAKSEQIDAELALVEAQIDRTNLKAPFAGYIVSGDLNQSLGSPVELGDILFEVAPLNQYRIVLEVSERDMAGVKTGLPGRIRIAAMPGDPVDFQVEQIVPLAVSDDGGSYFRVEAQLDREVPQLRPGMEGVARIEVGDRKLIWIWTHNLFSRLRLWFWSIGW